MGSRKVAHDKDNVRREEVKKIAKDTNDDLDCNDPMKKVEPKMAELINNEVKVIYRYMYYVISYKLNYFTGDDVFDIINIYIYISIR